MKDERDAAQRGASVLITLQATCSDKHKEQMKMLILWRWGVIPDLLSDHS